MKVFGKGSELNGMVCVAIKGYVTKNDTLGVHVTMRDKEGHDWLYTGTEVEKAIFNEKI